MVIITLLAAKLGLNSKNSSSLQNISLFWWLVGFYLEQTFLRLQGWRPQSLLWTLRSGRGHCLMANELLHGDRVLMV